MYCVNELSNRLKISIEYEKYNFLVYICGKESKIYIFIV